MLEMTTFGSDATRVPILIAHGLFGSARNWRAIAKRMATTRRIITVDMRNHGASFWADSQSYDNMAGDLIAVIESLGTPVDLVGHSMGGKAAMVLALRRPDLVKRLLVADIAPVAYAHSQNHLIDAMRGLDLGNLGTRMQADKALASVIDTTEVRAFLLQSLDIPEKRWRLNLEVLARDMNLITGFPETQGQFLGPTLFLAGANSDYILPEHRPLIRSLFPAAKQAKLPKAGHWLHAENPRAFIATMQVFLNV